MGFEILLIMMSCLAFVDKGECSSPSVKLASIVNAGAGRNQFPFQAALYVNSGRQTFFCGGSLISEEWVLTAAHCVGGMMAFEVVLGAYYLPDRNENGRQTFSVTSSNAYLHPKWSGQLFLYDIAVLKLPTKVTLDVNVQIIQLSEDEFLEESGKTATVSGWGSLKLDRKGTAEYLQYVDLSIISNGQCASIYTSITLKSSHICVSGTQRQNACQGDSGGPLIGVDDSGMYKQIGIVSFGAPIGCALGLPSAFTRVRQYIDFIQERTGIVPT